MAIFNLGENNESVLLNVAEVDTIIVPSVASDYRADNFQAEDRIDISGISETAQELIASAQALPGAVRLIGSFGQLTLIGIAIAQLREENFITNINQPVAIGDSAITTEDIPVAIPVLANDFDLDGQQPLLEGFQAVSAELGIVTRNDNGTPGVTSDDSLIYTPAAGFFGTDSFSYNISDGAGGTATGFVTVTVEPGNTPPIAQDDFAVTEANSPLDIFVLENDSDLDNDALSIAGVSGAAFGGFVSIAADGLSVLYQPQFGSAGIDSFSYTISDGQGGTDTATVTVTVVNEPPIAQDDFDSTSEGIPVTIAVLNNDSDPDFGPQPLFISDFQNGTFNGIVTSDGENLVYIPNLGFTGTDSFSYTVSDGLLSDTATVSVRVDMGNLPPIAENDLAVTTENIGLDIFVLDNDFDSDGDPLSITGVQTETTAGGTVTIDDNGSPFNGSDDLLVYEPLADFTGTDSFIYTISDGLDSATATVTVTVEPGNNEPVALPDFDSTERNTSVTIAVLDNDFDIDGDILEIAEFSETTAEEGTVSLDETSGQLVYSPAADFTGTDSFSYTISDGNGGTDSTEVTVTVVPEPNLPPEAFDDTAATNEDEAVTIAVLDNDSDPNDDSLSVTGVSQGADGSASISGEQVIYTPDADFFGSDSLTYTISDGEFTDTATVTLTVAPVNDAPIAVDDTAMVTEGMDVAIEVLDNDSDPDGDPLEISGVSDPEEGGTVSINGETVVYTPPEVSETVTDSFTYTLSDGELSETATVTVTVFPGNQAPIAVDDTTSTSEGIVTIAVLENDSDPDGDELSIVIEDFPIATENGGTVSIDNGGTIFDPSDDSLVYEAADGFTGTDSFTYTISDGELTSSATVNVTVIDINEPPIAINDEATTTENIAVTIAVLANDSDPDGDPLEIVEFAQTSSVGGTVDEGDDGALVYSPAADFTGTDSFSYTISDGQGGTASATVTVTVVDGNVPPIALPDFTETVGSSAVVVDVTDNDFDLDGDVIQVTDVSETTSADGTVEIGDDNQVTYTPAEDFVGPDSFTYTITDEQGATGTATVSVIVGPGNEPPIASDDTALTTEGMAVEIAVLDNDSDPDNGPEQLFISEFPDEAENGTIAQEGLNLVYTPEEGFVGTDTFSYTVSDGLDTDIATVTVTVEEANLPPIAEDDTTSTSEGIVTIAVLENDSDPDNGPEELSIVTEGFPISTPEGGIVTLDNGGTPIISNDDSLVYEAAVDFTGTDSFTYTISDGLATATATVTVTVIGNDPPVAVDDFITATEGIATSLMLLDNDSDPNVGDVVSLVGLPTTTAAGGTVALDRNGTFLDTSDDFLAYTSADGFTGTDNFTYTISDGELTDTGTVTVTVEPGEPNELPIAADDTTVTTVDIPATIAVLANDMDPDGDLPLSIAGVADPSNGSVSISGDEAIYTPDASFTGTDSFTYTIADARGATDAATVTVSVIGGNIAPIAVDDPATTDEDVAVTIAVLANDSDLNNDPFSITGVTQGANGSASITGGEVIYTPDADFSGTDSFTYTISDGELTDSATVSVMVDPVNDAPDAVDDVTATTEGLTTTIAVLDNDSDPDGDSLEITGLSETTAGGTVSIDGETVVYTPAAIDATVTDSFTYTISDGDLEDTATVTVTVTPDNLRPIAEDDVAATTEGIPATIEVLANDSDPENAPLTIEGVSTTTEGGTVSIDGETVVYTPPAVETGETITDTFTYTISDGDLTDSATVTVTVDAENEPPIAVEDLTATTEGLTATIAVLANDSDPENAPLTIEGLSGTSEGGTVSLDGETVIYTPPAVDATVTDSFTYTISDGDLTDSATVTVTVTPDNQPPIAVEDTATTTQNIPVTIAVLANDSDPDGDTLEITAITDPANGTATIDDNGTPDDASDDQIVYSPAEGFNGTDNFTYSISDGQGGTASATVTVTVEANQPPIAVDDSAGIVAAGATISIAVLENDSDPDGDVLTIDGVTDPDNGTASVDGALVSYTPDAGFTGDDSFTYTISDPSGETATAVVNISVQPAGDVTGTDGNDQIVGNDQLSTEAEGMRERIDGEAGDDTITGAQGADILSGGPGADRFVYLSLADSGADAAATNEGGDDILDFNPAEDFIQLNFDVAPGTPVAEGDVQINLDFIENGIALIGLSTPNTEPDFLPDQFVIRLSDLDPTTTADQIQNALIF